MITENILFFFRATSSKINKNAIDKLIDQRKTFYFK